MISKEQAKQLLTTYGKALQALHDNIPHTNRSSGSFRPGRADSQIIPNLLQALHCIATGVPYKPTEFVQGLPNIERGSSDPQAAFVELSKQLNGHFLNHYAHTHPKRTQLAFELANFHHEATHHATGILREKETHKACADVLAKIKAFIAKHPNVDGLQKMNAIMAKNTSSPAMLAEIIALANDKKSDSAFTKAFHETFRKRDPAVEAFYQDIAKLDIKKTRSLHDYAALSENPPGLNRANTTRY
ncbi:hypothetical protein DIZ81_11025 [Legionella taurinensis]|uniref:Uncharacterized protein n=1 Tax=Legionella taurinensis TaxID=70611 RepID=A0A3A5L3X4_9GAMM|nr:hypothetical protein [Legionella taurinensis]MDX1838383.1 hypothetical protein [Legionella taurinensis]PUT39143.1 hypothetical protein DB744_11035 [Legionella taurinensis]PUT39768.1 hypothetical protein DB746_13210 [Legionella taurinensis]PUT43599.1 hypothetical protein DB743_10425 [Legionella taurinensis]PUT45255.1 hypothetical protein DB745_13150 [Legionella taurinensis]